MTFRKLFVVAAAVTALGVAAGAAFAASRAARREVGCSSVTAS